MASFILLLAMVGAIVITIKQKNTDYNVLMSSLFDGIISKLSNINYKKV